MLTCHHQHISCTRQSSSSVSHRAPTPLTPPTLLCSANRNHRPGSLSCQCQATDQRRIHCSFANTSQQCTPWESKDFFISTVMSCRYFTQKSQGKWTVVKSFSYCIPMTHWSRVLQIMHALSRRFIFTFSDPGRPLSQLIQRRQNLRDIIPS